LRSPSQAHKQDHRSQRRHAKTPSIQQLTPHSGLLASTRPGSDSNRLAAPHTANVNPFAASASVPPSDSPGHPDLPNRRKQSQNPAAGRMKTAAPCGNSPRWRPPTSQVPSPVGGDPNKKEKAPL
jgi:hypothetical protein